MSVSYNLNGPHGFYGSIYGKSKRVLAPIPTPDEAIRAADHGRTRSEIHNTDLDAHSCLLGGGRKGRKGARHESPRKPRGKARGRSVGTGLINIGDMPQGRFTSIGPAQRVPLFRFQEQIHKFRYQLSASAFKTKTNLTGSQIKGAAAAYGLALAWSLADLPQAANLVALFDQFRFTKVVCRITSSHNTNTTGFGSLLYVAVDYDNSTLVTSVSQIQSYQSCQTLHGSDAGNGDSMVIEILPCIPIPSITGNMVSPMEWEDCAVTTNTHYGIKGWYATAAATDPVWDVDAQIHVEFRNTQ